MSSVDFFHLSSQPFNCLKTKPSGLPKSPKPTSSGLILCKSERTSMILKLIFLKLSFDGEILFDHNLVSIDFSMNSLYFSNKKKS